MIIEVEHKRTVTILTNFQAKSPLTGDMIDQIDGTAQINQAIDRKVIKTMK